MRWLNSSRKNQVFHIRFACSNSQSARASIFPSVHAASFKTSWMVSRPLAHNSRPGFAVPFLAFFTVQFASRIDALSGCGIIARLPSVSKQESRSFASSSVSHGSHWFSETALQCPEADATSPSLFPGRLQTHHPEHVPMTIRRSPRQFRAGLPPDIRPTKSRGKCFTPSSRSISMF